MCFENNINTQAIKGIITTFIITIIMVIYKYVIHYAKI